MIYRIVGSLQDVFDNVDPAQPLAYDSETIKKYGKIRIGQFYQEHWDQVKIVEHIEPMELIAYLAKIPDCNLVMQYAHYDITTIQTQLGLYWTPKTFSDTFLLSRLAYPKLTEFSLDRLIEYTLGYDPYKKAGIVKKEMQSMSWDKLALTDQQLHYASIDVYHLLDVYNVVKVQEESMCYKLDMLSLRYALDFQRNGMPVDEAKVMAMYKKNQQEIAEIALPVNCNSWKQVRPYINEKESDDLALAKFALQGNERAAMVRRARKLTKLNSFLNKYQTASGRIYGKFVPSARSGRFTSNDDNLQQIPRAAKSVFGVDPDSGRVLLYSDYSQLELRCIAALTKELVIYKLYSEGEDLHNYVARFVFGDDFTKEHRQIAKTINFNALYGGGAGMMQSILLKDANILLPIEQVSRIIRKWKKLFPAIAAWQERGIRAHRRGSLSMTPMGRQYVGRMMTDQLNIENQGFGSEIAKLAMHYMWPHLKEHEAILCDFIHDSFIIEMDNDPERYKVLAQLVAESMREAWTEGCKMIEFQDMPMPVDVYVGYNWGDIEAGEVIHNYRIAA